VGLILNSSLDSVDLAEAEAVKAAEETGFEEKDVHKIRLAVRECVANAVVHGNRYSAKKKVHFHLESSPGTLTIVVRDEGDGFEPEAIPDPLAEENLLRHSGRGLLMIREFMDDVEVQRAQPRGTEIRMSKYKHD
jgi:serine/threonine-protein kinase RsbW